MTARLRIWLLAAPLLALGSEAGHWLLIRLAGSDPERGREFFAHSGYGLGAVPVLLASAAALIFAALVMQVLGSQEARSTRVPGWLFAILPLVAFSLQEELEYALAHGRPSLAIMASWTFLGGLALQLPFALAAYLVAHVLGRAAVALARLRRSVQERRRQEPQVARWALHEGERHSPFELLASADVPRAPPLPAQR